LCHQGFDEGSDALHGLLEHNLDLFQRNRATALRTARSGIDDDCDRRVFEPELARQAGLGIPVMPTTSAPSRSSRSISAADSSRGPWVAA
jgi:hypothetical protein